MALTPGRWLRLLLLLLGGVFVALAPPGRDGNVLLGIFQQFTGWSSSDRFFGAAGANRDPERTQLSRVERVLHRAERRLLTMQRAQEAAGYVSRVRRDTGVVRTLFDGAVSPGIHSVAERLSQEVRRNLAVTGTVGATVMLVVRPGKGRTDAPDLWSAFTAAPAPGGCVVVITLDTLNRFPSYGWTDSRVSYCTYLAAFGPPGEGMRGLLNARQWDLVSGGAFTGPTRHAPAGHLDLQWWRSLVTAWTGDEWWRGRHPSEVGCQLGRPDACLRALRIDGQRASLWWGGDDAPYWGYEDWTVPLRRVNTELLPDLVREFGAGAVRRWWQDDRPAAVGFEAATGRPLGEWLASYLPRKLGRTLSGPVARWQSALLALALSLGALGLATYAMMRREVR